MIHWNWLTASGSTLLMVFISGVGIYVALLLFTRLAGLRSFSKMSSFDFAITIAFGSVIASTLLTKDPPLTTGVFALAVLYAIQWAVSRARRRTWAMEWLVDNQPLLLMARGRVIREHLTQVRMTEQDLISKLRMAGVTQPGQVLAVVMESTGDVSVLKVGEPLDPWIMTGVRGAEALEDRD